MNRNCELLGICQHHERECTGACQQPPRLPTWTEDNAPMLLEDSPIYRVLFVLVCLVSAGIVWGVASYLLDTFGPAIERALWTIAAIRF